jgi:hypothetical protein
MDFLERKSPTTTLLLKPNLKIWQDLLLYMRSILGGDDLKQNTLFP